MNDEFPPDMPEPIRRMIEQARAAGANVRVAHVHNEGEVQAALLRITGQGGEDAVMLEKGQWTEGHVVGCTCHWCTLNSMLHAVQETEELSPPEKFEAVDKLFDGACDAARAAPDGSDHKKALFSLRVQQLSFKVNGVNRAWAHAKIKERTREIIASAIEKTGAKASPDDDPASAIEAIKHAILAKVDDPTHDSIEMMVQASALNLALKDIMKMHEVIVDNLPPFYVHDETNPAALARLV